MFCAQIPFEQEANGKSSSRTAPPRGSDISLQTGRRRFMQSGFHVHKTPGFGIFHGFFEFVWNPGIIVFHDKFGHLRPFVCRQPFKLLNDFDRTHGSIISRNLLFARRFTLPNQHTNTAVFGFNKEPLKP
jgi:hypothetical protein